MYVGVFMNLLLAIYLFIYFYLFIYLLIYVRAHRELFNTNLRKFTLTPAAVPACLTAQIANHSATSTNKQAGKTALTELSPDCVFMCVHV